MSTLSEHHSDISADDRDALVIDHLRLADSVARRYAWRGEDLEDLRQVARVGLVHAAQRYDAVRGDFAAFATPTITGEVKRHFRDHGWLVRPPRRTQELQAQIDRTYGELTQTLGRDPSTDEIADVLGLDPVEVSQARAARSAYHGVSLDRPIGDDTVCLADCIGAVDPEYERSELRTLLRQACRGLSAEDRNLLRQRFVEERSQSDIARELGTHQMAISRRLAAIMAQLRRAMDHNLHTAPFGRRGRLSRHHTQVAA